MYFISIKATNQPTNSIREPLRNICTLFIKSFSSLQLYVSRATLPPLPWMLGISICLTFQKLQISAVIIEDFHAKVKQVNIAGKHGESARRTGNTEPFLTRHREMPRDLSNRGRLAAKRHTSYLTCSSDRFIPPLRNALEVIRRLEGILGVGAPVKTWRAI